MRANKWDSLWNSYLCSLARVWIKSLHFYDMVHFYDTFQGFVEHEINQLGKGSGKLKESR